MCESRCQREHDCDPTLPVDACMTRCQRLLSPRVIYDRPDFVAEVKACALRQGCTGDVDRGIRACIADVDRRLEPSAIDRTYCSNTLAENASCRVNPDKSDDYEHCIDGTKRYTDVILSQLDECNEGPCRAREMCSIDVVGHDTVNEDEDFQEKRRAVAVEDAGSATVNLAAKTQRESPRGPLSGASVCIKDSTQCATTDSDGDASLPIPAHGQVAITFVAPGFRSVLVPLTTAGNKPHLNVTMNTVESVSARFARVGLTVPDAATGVLTVKTWSLEEKGKPLEGVAVSVVPPTSEAMYSAPDGALTHDRKDTSSLGSATFAGLQPGTVEVVAGPADVICVPSAWAWPSANPSSLAAPIAAGFTTEVSMQCHR